MSTKTTVVPEPTAATRTCLGDTCPLRSTAEDQRYDYCEGCPDLERWCRSCQQFKPQVGWWWGYSDGGLWTWVCADCRFPPLNAEEAARNPALAASHPALAELTAGHERFSADLELGDSEPRYEAAQALSRAATTMGHRPAGLVLGRMAEVLRAADFTGHLEVDVADVDMPERQQVLGALHRAAYDAHTPQLASVPLVRLMRVWERWMDPQVPARSRPMTEQEQRDRDRAAVRRARERTKP